MYKRRLDSKGTVIPDSVEKHKVRPAMPAQPSSWWVPALPLPRLCYTPPADAGTMPVTF